MKLKPGTYLREPCVVIREGGREASVAVRVARDIEHRKRHYLGRRGFPLCRRQHVRPRYGERADRPTVSETPWTHASILSGPGRSLHYLSLWGRSPKRRLNADRRTYGGEKSDATIQAMKPANKAGVPSWRSQWSEASHPRGNREVSHVPDTASDTACHRGRIGYGCGSVCRPANVMRDGATQGRSRMR